MTRHHLLRLGALAGALAFGNSGCTDDSNTGPSAPTTGGTVTVSLDTPNADDGALMIIVKGAGPPTIQPMSNGYQVYWRAVQAGETRVIVVGDITAGPLFKVTAAPDASASRIAASVSEVATRTDELRTSTAGYTLTLAP